MIIALSHNSNTQLEMSIHVRYHSMLRAITMPYSLNNLYINVVAIILFRIICIIVRSGLQKHEFRSKCEAFNFMFALMPWLYG